MDGVSETYAAKKTHQKYLQIYYELRPSKEADRALRAVFYFLSYGNGNSNKADKIIKELPKDGDYWHLILNDMIGAYINDNRFNSNGDYKKRWPKIIKMYQNLLKSKNLGSQSKSYILRDLSSLYKHMGKKDKAISGFRKVISMNVDNMDVLVARRYLNQLEKLKIGDIGPNFSVKDIYYSDVKLNKINSNYILLFFWLTTCSPCKPYYPRLRKIYNSVDRDSVEIIGIADSHFFPHLWAILTEDFPWINIQEHETPGENGNNTIHELFGIAGWPSVYLLDREKRILAMGREAISFLNKEFSIPDNEFEKRK